MNDPRLLDRIEWALARAQSLPESDYRYALALRYADLLMGLANPRRRPGLTCKWTLQ